MAAIPNSYVLRGTQLPAALAALTLAAFPLHAQLLSNLASFPDRISVGDPQVASNDHKEGPKGIASADFNGDGKPDLAAGNLDGTVTVLIGQGGGRFAAPRHLRTGALELRAVLAVDLNGDAKPDLSCASPMDGKLLLYFNDGSGNFGAAVPLEGWTGVRCLAAGDFDGDGVTDLAAAGPGIGVRHFRGTGGGAFEIMGDLPRLSPAQSELPRPVYAMHTIRSRDGQRDDLLVTHAESPALYVLSTVPEDRSGEPPMNLAKLPGWRTLTAPVLLHEVQVHNATTLLDADGTAQPWVELLNKTAASVNLQGWALRSDTAAWVFPAVTIQPGRMLVVFLSGKNRNILPELHASFQLNQNSRDLSLLQPGGTLAHTLTLTQHSVPDVSFGLATDLNAAKYFDIPSPGAENNAGLNNLDDLHPDAITTLTITPRKPAPGQSVTVRVTMPDRPTGTSSVRHVWFSAMKGLREEHYVMHKTGPGVYEEVLPPGAFSGSAPHRVLARLQDGTGNDYTSEVHRGLDETETSRIAAPRPGRLLPVASVPSPKVKAFEVGAVRSQAGLPEAQEDLVYADDVCGLLRVHRAGPGARRFDPMPSQDVPVRGAPRDVKLSDTDGDGWLDATVVLRSLDLAMTFKNEGGVFRASGELPTGRSPREAVMADFTGDGKPDAAVINRYSADISVLPTASNFPGLVSLDQIYSVNGEVAGLTVRDFNDDGRDDVMQLHRASGEVSIRTAGPDGTLGAPVFLSTSTAGPDNTGQSPSGMTSADVNNDERPDMLTANLGFGGNGSISVLLAKADGTYESPRNFTSGGGMFAVSAADFDNDGNMDVVAGLFDCRVAFFRGDGAGNFTSSYTVTFAYEARVMVTGDFDQDGDTDIAGAGYSGEMVTLENRGAATAGGWSKRVYPAPSGAHGTHRIGISYVNADLDPDLIVGTGGGVLVFTGRLGMSFESAPEYSGGLGISVSDVLTEDLDGDGSLEMVVACRNDSCINILTQNAAGEFGLMTQADVPSGRYLASGDLDGDGKPDLVGTGDVLWTALSSRAPQTAAAGATETNRTQSSEVVINEVLSQNTGVPIVSDNGRKSDFMEIYNGGTAAVNLTGWKVRLQGTQEGVAVDTTWTLPAITAGAKSHALVVFSLSPGTMNTGFTLPAEGGTLTLLKPDNSEADLLTYPQAQENVSWSRYLDGHPSFRADRIPSPGMSNLDNGTVPPEVKLNAPSPSAMIAGQPLKFTARGRDDAGIMSLSLLWNRLDEPLSEPQRIVLYDDGMHQDAGAVDGLFAGYLAPGLPAGAEVQFFLEAVDLSGEVLLLPDSAELVADGEEPVAWSFSLTSPPPLEITEVCANNVSALRDDLGGYADWVTVRNNGTVPQDMTGIILARSPLAGSSSVYAYPPGLILPAGGEITVFADNNTAQGALHAPFTLDAGGDDLSLLAVTPSGARQWIHSLAIPVSLPDSRLRMLPGTDLRAVIAADANLTNWSGTAVNHAGEELATVHFTAFAGSTYNIDGDARGEPVTWMPLQSVPGDGAVHTITWPVAEMAALRVVAVAPVPSLRVDAVLPAAGRVGIYGVAPGAVTVDLFLGTTDGGTVPDAWPATSSSSGAAIGFHRTASAGVTYFYRLRATNAAGSVWSPAGTTFFMPPLTDSAPDLLTLRELNPTNIRVDIRLNTAPPPGATVALLAGTVDAFGSAAAWQRTVAASPSATENLWSADLTGLNRETNYFVRAVVTSGGGQVVSSQRLSFRTPNAGENLVWNLRLSEIMYNPGGNLSAAEAAAGFEEPDFEYIELHNASDESMDLSGLWFENGLEFDFPLTGVPVLPPGGYAVIAAHPHAFAMRYGATIPLAGWTLHPFRSARLANGGEVVTLRSPGGTLLFDINYNDSPWWTDGGGNSLEFLLPSGPFSLPEQSVNYISSRLIGGTPGQAAVPAPDLTFTNWNALSFTAAQLTDPATSGPDADPDGDGLSNFAEFACGTRPLSPDSKDVLAISSVEGFPNSQSTILTFPVNVRAAGIRTIIESGGLSGTGWNSVGMYAGDHFEGSVPGSFIPVSTALTADGEQILVTIMRRSNSPAEPRRFFRLFMSGAAP